MKKLISIFLAITLIFSISGFAFAGTQILTENVTQTVHLENDEGKEFTFIPQSDGVYMVSIEFTDSESFALVYLMITANGNCITYENSAFCSIENSYFFNNDTGSSRFPAEKGKEITVLLYNNKISEYDADILSDEITGMSYNQSADIEVTVTKVAVRTFEKNKNYTVTGNADCCFYVAPEQDEIYYIASDSDYMLYAYVTTDGDQDYNYCDSDDGGSEIVFRLEKGKKYMLLIEGSSENFTFTTADGSNVKPVRIDMDSFDITVGDKWFVNIDCYPVGSEINSEGFTVTVDNEKLADVYLSEESGFICVEGLRPGIVNVTVTENSTGASDTGTIVILSEFQEQLLFSSYSLTLRLISGILTFFYDLFNKFTGC